jgi:pilus assembly protein CpaB
VKNRLILVLAFALVVSAGASVLIYRLVAAQLASHASQPTNHVLVASRNLVSGDLIKEGDVTVANWGGAIPQGAIQKPEDAIGRGVIEPIYAGEPIVESRIAARGAGAGLAAIIPAGMRAVAVRVNDVAGVAGFVTPGMRVDILVAGNPPGGSSLGTQTNTLLQNIEVLSAGQDIQKDAEGKPVSVPVVNLLVTPEQAEVLGLASNEARIQMVLRNPTDKEQAKTRPTALAYLFNGVDGMPGKPVAAPKGSGTRRAAPPRPVMHEAKAPPPTIPITVEVIQGTQRTEAKFVEKNPAAAGTAPEVKQ